MRARRFFRKLTGRAKSGTSKLSTPAIHRAVLRAIEKAAPAHLKGDHLDVGSGKGEFLALLAQRYPLRSLACDYTDQLMETPGQKVDIVNLNREPLPFADNRFVLVTCIETIEHLENSWQLVREIYRVLQPGAVVVLSTPNILNLRSRLRYLSSGFYNLFGPLQPDEQQIYSPKGHINPVSWFYIANALLSTGYTDVAVSVDKYQRRSFLALPFLIGPIWMSNRVVIRRELKKYGSINEKNATTVRAMNSTDLLLGRTLIVSAKKPR